MGKRNDGWKQLPYSGVPYRQMGDIGKMSPYIS